MHPTPINLVWLRNDLRLHDQPILQQLAAQGEYPGLAVVFILPQHWQQPDPHGLTRLGLPKARFLRACLIDVQRSLYQQNIRLSLLGGDQVALLRNWYEQQPFHLHTAAAQAPEEAGWLRAVAEFAPVTTYEPHTLFRQQQLAEQLQRFQPRAGQARSAQPHRCAAAARHSERRPARSAGSSRDSVARPPAASGAGLVGASARHSLSWWRRRGLTASGGLLRS